MPQTKLNFSREVFESNNMGVEIRVGGGAGKNVKTSNRGGTIIRHSKSGWMRVYR